MLKKIQYNTLLVISLVITLNSASLGAGGASGSSPGSSSALPILPRPVPLVVTTIKPLAIIAQSAAGDAANIEYLVPANQSPHDFSLPVSALKKIASADLVVWIGRDFETRSAKTMAQIPTSKLVSVIDQIASQADSAAHDHSDGHGLDPHLWLDPNYGNAIAAEIQSRLGLPIKEILDQDSIQVLQASLASSADKTYLTHHDAYAHFVRAFKLPAGFPIRDIRGDVKGVKSQYQLRKTMASANIGCVFVEPQYQGKDAAVIAAEFGLPLVALDPQGLSQPLNNHAYSEFISSLVAQFKACFQ